MQELSKKKVAFLALTYSSFAQESLMQKYFSQAHDDWSLYIHNKAPFDSELARFCVQGRYKVETSWAEYSLTLATIRLMAAALEDSDNEWFVLISDTHCPVYNIQTTCEKVRSEFSVMSFTSCEREQKFKDSRFDLILNKHNRFSCPFKPSDALFVSQWFVCRRSDAKFFVENEPKFRKWFVQDKICFPDEMYFCMLANHFNLPFQIKQICHFNWHLKSSKKMVAAGARSAPKTYEKIDRRFIKVVRDTTPYLFIRKVNHLTEINESFILSS